MNFKVSIIAISLLAVCAAAAAKTSKKQADSVAGEEIGFSQVRGDVYNQVGNPAIGRLSLGGWMSRPSHFFGHKFFYANLGENYRGLVSWGDEEMKWILGYGQTKNFSGIPTEIQDVLDNFGSNALGLLSFGLANSSFGVLLNVGLGKINSTETIADGTEATTSVTLPGDIFGLNFSMPLGGYFLRASASYGNVELNTVSEDYEDLNNVISLTVGFGNPPSAERFYWEGGLSLDRYSLTEKDPSGTKTKPEARSEISPFFNVGYKALVDDVARVVWGFNNKFVFVPYDERKEIDLLTSPGDTIQITTTKSDAYLVISPNVVGDILITDNLIAFGEVSHNIIIAFGNEETTAKDVTTKESYSAMLFLVPKTTVSAGLRLQGKRAAMEAVLTEDFYTSIFKANLFHGALNGFIYF